jgi:hypothetical protein
MSWIAIIGAVLKLVILILSVKFEKDAALKAKKEQAIKEVEDGIKNKDASAITAAFDSINRM